MNEDKIIEVSSEAERRHYARRREDRGERKWAPLQAAAILYSKDLASGPELAVSLADSLLVEIESREAERGKEGE